MFSVPCLGLNSNTYVFPQMPHTFLVLSVLESGLLGWSLLVLCGDDAPYSLSADSGDVNSLNRLKI